jgi:hypothetical protein
MKQMVQVLQPRYILTSHIVAMIGSSRLGLDQRASSARLGTSSAEGSVPSRPQLADSPAGYLESGKGYQNGERRGTPTPLKKGTANLENWGS